MQLKQTSNNKNNNNILKIIKECTSASVDKEDKWQTFCSTGLEGSLLWLVLHASPIHLSAFSLISLMHNCSQSHSLNHAFYDLKGYPFILLIIISLHNANALCKTSPPALLLHDLKYSTASFRQLSASLYQLQASSGLNCESQGFGQCH